MRSTKRDVDFIQMLFVCLETILMKVPFTRDILSIRTLKHGRDNGQEGFEWSLSKWQLMSVDTYSRQAETGRT
jgi:hypothetical protein